MAAPISSARLAAAAFCPSSIIPSIESARAARVSFGSATKPMVTGKFLAISWASRSTWITGTPGPNMPDSSGNTSGNT